MAVVSWLSASSSSFKQKILSDWTGSRTREYHTPTVTKCVVGGQELGVPAPLPTVLGAVPGYLCVGKWGVCACGGWWDGA